MKHSLNSLFFLFILVSCNIYKLPAAKDYKKLNISDAIYIFKAEAPSKSSMALDEGFWKLTEQGNVEPLKFLDENGDPVDCTIEIIWQVADNYLGCCTGGPWGVRRWLIDKRTANVYTYPENAFIGPWDFSICNFNHRVYAFEYDNKLYIAGNPFSEANLHYQVVVDVINQTSTRLTPEGLDTFHFMVGNNGLISFSANDECYVLTPNKKMVKLGENNSGRIFTDKNHNMYLLSRDTEDFGKCYVGKIDLSGDSIVETSICESEAAQFPSFDDSFYTIVNELNGNVLFCGKHLGGIWEFDGTSVKCVNEDSMINWRNVDVIGFGNNTETGFMHNYFLSIPEDNFFINDIRENKVQFLHLNLRTYEYEMREYELYPEEEYMIIGEIEHRNGYISYPCIRFSDSNIVTFTMDYTGKCQMVNESDNSYFLSQLVLL